VVDDSPVGWAACLVSEKMTARRVIPASEEQAVGVVGVEDIARTEVLPGGKLIAEGWEFAGRKGARQIPAARDKATAIDPDGLGADSVIQKTPFVRGIDVPSSESSL
jgi:predicted lipoprotein